jgi:hypothetical protein
MFTLVQSPYTMTSAPTITAVGKLAVILNRDHPMSSGSRSSLFSRVLCLRDGRRREYYRPRMTLPGKCSQGMGVPRCSARSKDARSASGSIP